MGDQIWQDEQEADGRVERVAALDIAKASAVVCLRVPGTGARRVARIEKVAAVTSAINELGDLLVCQGIELVVMEATGDYWRPFFYLLESRGLRVWLVNARDVKNVPGRAKTDRLDAVWLAKLAERGMLRPSFIPPAPVRELQDLTRLREVLVGERTRYRNRVEKVLEDALIKLSLEASDLFGVSGRAMLEALIAGQRSPAVIADLARGTLRNKIPALRKTLEGRFTEHHAYQLRLLLENNDRLDAQIAELDATIERRIRDLEAAGPRPPAGPGVLERLDEIPGVGRACAQAIVAEIGLDMSAFPTPGHLASWAKLTPRAIQSGSKNTHGPTGKGNRWLKAPLGQAANSAKRGQTFLGARYRRLIKHMPKKKAQTAIARNILEIAWHLINDPALRFHDLGPDWHERHLNQARATRNHQRALENLGYTVTLTRA